MTNTQSWQGSDFGILLADAGRYWERQRIIYNAVLAGVVIVWVMATWPHFRPAFTWPTLLPLLGLAGIANLFYCAAYLIDVPMQFSALRDGWRNRRWTLWLLGTIFAFALTNYWIADEIYPLHRKVSGDSPKFNAGTLQAGAATARSMAGAENSRGNGR